VDGEEYKTIAQGCYYVCMMRERALTVRYVPICHLSYTDYESFNYS
jgi:hypothetical protein